VPSFVWVVDEFPMTQTNKVLKRDLVKQRWHAVETDPSARIWWRPIGERTTVIRYVAFTASDAAALREAFAANGRLNLL
jgi:hypothetical protein